MAVVPAAGSGSRFSKTELKQYQYIQNHTVLEHTVNRLNSLDLAGCVLAIGEQDHFAKTLSFQQKDKLHFCLGGAERVHSVLNALIYLSEIPKVPAKPESEKVRQRMTPAKPGIL